MIWIQDLKSNLRIIALGAHMYIWSFIIENFFAVALNTELDKSKHKNIMHECSIIKN